jgi:hypothetical protein
MKYLIIGGGIAGLYSALLLSELANVLPKDITVLEKGYRWGRRVHTLERDGIKYECGAGRFSEDHKLLMTLIKRYGLEDKMIELSKKTQDRQILNGRMMIPTNLEPYFDKLFSIPQDKTALLGKTLFDVATEMFGVEIASLMTSVYGFDEEFKLSGAYDALKLAGLTYRGTFYIMSGGLEQIITKIVEELTEKGLDLRLDTKCTKWRNLGANGFEATITDFNGTDTFVNCEKIILAIDKWGLMEFSELEPVHNLIDSVAIVPLTRIYARFPINEETGFAWFHGIPATTTNLPIRMFIPIDEKNGMCMISYSDGYFASQWQNDFIMNKLDSIIMNYIRQMFPEKQIPEPEWIQKLHWANGCHSWLPLVNSDIIYNQIQNPFRNIYICGETFSRWQGWIEGALETASEVYQKITNPISNDKKLYSENDISKSKNLTIINGRVYDLSKMDWINTHPGGNIIEKAIGIDSTHMFEYISHPAYVMNILEDLYVGDLNQ